MIAAALDLFASRKTAIVLLVAAVISSLFAAEVGLGGSYPVIVIVGLLSVSLMICLQQNFKRWWRRNKGLLAFHVGLIGVSLSALASGLTHYHAYFELTENQSINNEFTQEDAGPLYRDNLMGFQFSLLSSMVTFNGREDLGRGLDEQLVEVIRPESQSTVELLEFNKPIIYGHYRFYLASNQGYSVIFQFTDRNGATRPGVVPLPTYPESRSAQISDFGIPGSSAGRVAVSMPPDAGPFDEDSPWSLKVPDNPSVDIAYTENDQRLTVSLGLGSTLDIAGGTLTFEGIPRWHGFLVDYDPTRPYLVLFILLAMGGISWHYIQMTRRTET